MTTPSIATNPLYQHFVPHQIEDEHQQQQRSSVLLELANDTKKIAQVFPLMNQSSLPEQPAPPLPALFLPSEEERRGLIPQNHNNNNPSSYSTYEATKDGKENNNNNLLNAVVIRHPMSLNVAKYERNPAYNSRSGSFNVQYPITPAGITSSQPITPSSYAKAPVTPFLSVQPQAPYRAVSAELLAPIEDSDLRRASFDNGFRKRRLLPSTEHLEKQKSEEISTRYDVPQIVAPHQDEEVAPPVPRRRASFLPRSDAIETPYTRKQNSSPLPQQNHRIYERGHLYSRSWNAEFYDETEDRDLRQRYGIAEELRVEDPRRYYHSGGQSHPKLPHVPPQSPKLPPPPSLQPPPVPSHMLVPPQITFTRQTKSFDSSSPFTGGSLLPSPSAHRFPPLERRSFSERERQQLAAIRQNSNPPLSIPHPSVSDVSRQCQGLWQARKVLENHKLPIQQQQRQRNNNASTDLSDDGPSAVSTSFESNTESINNLEYSSTGKLLLDLPRQNSNADAKRQKYRSLLTFRQLQRTTCPEASSFESGAESDSTNKLNSSLDSAGQNSDEYRRTVKPKGPRYRSMMHLTRKPTSLQKTIAKRTFSAKYIATKSLIRPLFHHGGNSIELKRDYSVDVKSDSIFRHFARVDPRFEISKAKATAPAVVPQKNLIQVQYPPGFKPAPRRRSSKMMLAMAQYRSADNAEFRFQNPQPQLQLQLQPQFPMEVVNKGSYHNIYHSKPY